MKKKNQRLALVAVVLLLINLSFLGLGNRGVSSTRQPEIAIGDTSLVQQVVLTQGDQTASLSRNGQSWVLNGNYGTDPTYTRILLAVLSRVSVKRELG